MTAISATSVFIRPLNFSVMAKKRDATSENSEATEPKNFRLRVSVIEAVERYKRRHPLRPTLTQIIELALVEFVSNHEAELPPEQAKKRKP